MKCKTCGNIITYFKNSGVVPQCCGEPMTELVPGTTDGPTAQGSSPAKMAAGPAVGTTSGLSAETVGSAKGMTGSAVGTTSGTGVALEKHVPVIKLLNGTCDSKIVKMAVVDVGSDPHPMTESHRIEWIILETNCGYHVRYLNQFAKPQAEFYLAPNEEVQTAYEFCNLHGLWRSKA